VARVTDATGIAGTSYEGDKGEAHLSIKFLAEFGDW
jgi:hypothetical protein